MSAGVETLPKGRHYRFVPLAQPANRTLARLSNRREFLGPDCYVFCTALGTRMDESALQRRYKRVCAAAGLRHATLHRLRHAAASIVARTTDPSPCVRCSATPS